MANYVDGFVIPLPKKNLNTYRRLAQKAGRVWKDHGALEFRECVGDDLNVEMGLSFPRGIKTKPGETVLFPISRSSHALTPIASTQGDEGPAYAEDDEVGTDAFRWQTDNVRRIQEHRRSLTL
jgi:uncharacterized protein YbaA (DUF1428 family)